MKVKNLMLCATAVAPSLAWAEELPNIIYIVTDQQTASAMSCMGNDDLHTPNMDKPASCISVPKVRVRNESGIGVPFRASPTSCEV